MRVAIIADFPWGSLDGSATGRGGGQGCTWLPQLAENFERHPDLEIHWVSLDRRGPGGECIRKYNQQFKRLKGTSVSVDLALGCIPTRRKIRKYLRELKPDIVHAWGTESIYPVALRDFEGPSILSMQGVLTEYKRIGGLPDDWRWRRMVAGEPAMIRSATIVSCESGWGIARVKEVVPTAHCRMVEYGVHPRFFDVPWQPDPAKPYMLYVGGTGTRKGFDLLLDALEALPDRNWELRLAGDELMRAEVERRGLQNVRCLGLLAWNEMENELRGAWASVLPTRGDTSPNSVKEARVVGVPVITSRHGGQAGYIRDGENGRIVDPLTVEGLAEALADVMSSFDRAAALGRGRHQEDRDYLNAERTAKGFAELYHELAKGSRKE